VESHLPEPPRVLVIEDEPLICALALEALSDFGYIADDAASAAEALAKLGDSPFDAVIIDVGLPDRPGDALAEEVRARWPALIIVMASGYDGVELARRFAADPLVRIVTKPYSIEALHAALLALGVAPPPQRQVG
jgi:CheY-like chemotaxis protein